MDTVITVTNLGPNLARFQVKLMYLLALARKAGLGPYWPGSMSWSVFRHSLKLMQDFIQQPTEETNAGCLFVSHFHGTV